VHHYRKEHPFFEAVEKALLRLGVTSRFAFLIMDETTPDTIIVARRGSNPVLWSQHEGTIYFGSQAAVFHGYTQHYQEVPEGHVIQFGTTGPLQIKNITGEIVKEFQTRTLDAQHEGYEKKGAHWMYQEMRDARETITRALGHRISHEAGIVLGGIEDSAIQERLRKIDRFIIAGCGTSYHAAQIIALQIEEIAGIQAQAIIASEYIYRTTIFDPQTTALICISQSGETADVIRLMQEWKPRQMLMLGIVNMPDTQIPRLTDAGIYCNIGPEIAVASTKAFLGQIVCGTLFALWMAQQRGMSIAERDRYITELLALPEKAERIFEQEDHMKELATTYATHRDFLFLGRKYHAVVAAEGALKLKEISYIHAEAYPSGEMKHGTIALIDKDFPTLVIAPHDSVYAATMNNVAEIQARQGKVILITDDNNLDSVASHGNQDATIIIPSTLETLSPILTVIPTQLFAYYACLARGYDPDQPRNLAKSVTVE
jgi:glucosamine--fructose-6-phosphate aminotransferase (isomerizing)